MKKIAIIGASYLQLPLIRKAKELGYVTYVFAWEANDIGEKEADYFYPISIIEKEKILNKCREIEIDGICSIGSDLAIITVNYVAQCMGLVSNTLKCNEVSTNKNLMRRCFAENEDPSPKSILVNNIDDVNKLDIKYPIIIKPLDRSGSRGITKLESKEGLEEAINKAKQEGFKKEVLIEEFVEGEEYSVECISYEGKHQFLQMTYKYTTGSPSFIETAHLEPAPVSKEMLDKVIFTVFHALDSLKIVYGASHSEIKIDKDKNIKIIEVGGRMGGDLIGSSLVRLSTGYDFVENVLNIALRIKPNVKKEMTNKYSAVIYIFNKKDLKKIEKIKKDNPDILVEYMIFDNFDENITDSSNRHGYYVICSENKNTIYKYLPTIPSEI